MRFWSAVSTWRCLNSAVWVVVLFAVLTGSEQGWGQGTTSKQPQQAPAADEKPATEPATVEDLAARLKAMEAQNRDLVDRLERRDRVHEEQLKLLLERIEHLTSRIPATSVDPAVDRSAGMQEGVNDDLPLPDLVLPDPVDTQPELAPFPSPVFPAEDGGFLAEKEYTGPVPEFATQPIEPNPFRESRRLSTIAEPGLRRLESYFGPGFQFRTEDEEFRLQIHLQSQVESRVWSQPNGAPFQDGFFFPRQRIFFVGNMTRPIEYTFSINRGIGELGILDAFLNYHPRDEFQIRFGRYFTPMGFDQFAVRNLWLTTPERSLFTTNLGPNRQIGLMAWGYLFNKRLDYAVGLFTGPRNSFEDFNSEKDVQAFINARPFQDTERLGFLRYLNIGTSASYGVQNQPAVPLSFAVGAVAPTNASQATLATAPFLRLDNDVLERGARLLGSVHIAYFFRQLSVISEWQYGYGTYASPSQHTTAQVPFGGYYITAAYFLTGEHVDRRVMVVPRRPLIPTGRGQQRGIGAWEAVWKISELGLGDQVFTDGIADRSRWSNSVTTHELGANWYWNEYLKVYMFWLHGSFGDPVQYVPGQNRQNVDMFWLRFQLYF